MVCRLSSTWLGVVTNYAFSMGVCPILGLEFGWLIALMSNFIALASGLSADQGWALEWGACF